MSTKMKRFPPNDDVTKGPIYAKIGDTFSLSRDHKRTSILYWKALGSGNVSPTSNYRFDIYHQGDVAKEALRVTIEKNDVQKGNTVFVPEGSQLVKGDDNLDIDITFLAPGAVEVTYLKIK